MNDKMAPAGRSAGFSAVLHPLLLAAYPILFLYSQNIQSVGFELVATPVVISVSISAALLALFSLALKSVARGAVLVSAWLILFWTYGHIYGWIEVHFVLPDSTRMSDPAGARTGLRWTLGAIWVVAFLSAPLLAERLGTTLIRAISTALNVLAAFLLVTPIWVIGSTFISEKRATHGPEAVESVEQIPQGLSDYPDLYVLVMDSYARKDILEEHFGRNNEEFLGRLESLGFSTATKSRSNYSWTYLSLPSLLNLDYIHRLQDERFGEPADVNSLIRLFRDNSLLKLLRSKGLSSIHLQSTYALSQRNPVADVEYSCDGYIGSDFYRLLITSSFLRIWINRTINNLARCHLEQFNRIESVSRQSKPKFLFAHFIPPHHPYLFDIEGNIRRNVNISDQFDIHASLWSRRDEYSDQLEFMNSRILQLLDIILMESQRDVVVVLVSDHGPQLIESDGSRSPGYQSARFANLVSVFSSSGKPKISQDVTLVNLFRLILNQYYDEDFEILKNQYFDSEFGRPAESTELWFQSDGTYSRNPIGTGK